ncbi:hypothetical protein [Actinocrispum sp. NPDC049592]|uniref:hypothetical protein n=1 Tax=Actinocrispum sp. NPDC049592 TaxID=3154835 RepID=UPI00342D010F
MVWDDVRFTMPPQPSLYVGRDAVAEFFAGRSGTSGSATSAWSRPAPTACPPRETG